MSVSRSNWMHEKTKDFLATIDQLKAADAFPFLRPFENIGPRIKIGRQSYINFTSNDYLGLSQHPSLIDRAVKGTQHYGTGLGSSRLQASTDLHDVLEQRLAQWMGYDGSCVFATGYQSMVGFLSAYLDGECAVILDNLSHASILDGVYLAKGYYPDLEMRFFKHNSPNGLQRALQNCERKKKLVVVEGLYGADGDIAPLDKFVEVCRKHDAQILVDDAHGIGSIGPTGRGAAEQFGVLGDVDIIMGSFSKSFGTVGGFILADKPIVDYLKVSAKAFTFSASLPIAQVGAALAALNIMEKDQSRLRKLQRNAAFFRQGLQELGFNTGDSAHHIAPIILGEEEKTVKFAAYLFHGAQVIMLPFVYPGVPKGKARLRCNVTASHAQSDMGYALEALATIAHELDVLPKTVHTRATKLQKARWLAQTKLAGVKTAGLGYIATELVKAGKKATTLTRRDRSK